MRCILSLVILGVLLLFNDPSWARREALTAEQKSQMERIDRVLITVLALSDKGAVDAGPLVEVAANRMKEFGYTPVTDPTQPHDVELKIKCEQKKTWEGTTTMGSDADLPDAPSRIWKGPACQLGYLLNGKKMAWRKEVRTDFDDAQAAATLAKAGDPTAYAMARLQTRLEEYDFPALITAEWGQETRLFQLYDDPKTPVARKVKLVALFGDLFSVKAIPRLPGRAQRTGSQHREGFRIGARQYRTERYDPRPRQDDEKRCARFTSPCGKGFGNRWSPAWGLHHRRSFA
ncbi:MAG: hypothetical protein QM771_14280 [Nitrospira sp.]